MDTLMSIWKWITLTWIAVTSPLGFWLLVLIIGLPIGVIRLYLRRRKLTASCRPRGEPRP